MAKIRVPASTSNLGPGFDSHGLALGLYLTVEVEPTSEPFGVFTFEGEGADELRSAKEENLILRAMRFAAANEEVELYPARLRVQNQIPLARGLGSSAAAIIAGLSAFEIITNRQLSTEKLLAYAAQLEGHADNIAAALLGSFVVSCLLEDGRVLAARLEWPERIRTIAVIPDLKVRTEEARAALPRSISHRDAVYNLQRASLFVAAIAGGQEELLGQAMRDRLHQPYRARLAPGLEEALELAECDVPGLIGLALSGSGPTVIAFAATDLNRIADLIAERFHQRGISCQVRFLEVERQGRVVEL
jgi:homoserine kinase